MSSSPFVFEIGADVSKFTKSISEVDAELKELRNVLKTQTGAAIVETNKQIVALETSLVNLKKVGLDKLPKGAADGANALNSLSQVTRDLPFGFIAIQNNLPMVVDSFGQLAKQSGGVGAAFKSIGASLLGPAGLSFAFGAVISGVTALIQKYGSLGEAMNAILGLSPKISAEQKLYNEETAKAAGNVAAESAKIDILVKTLTNLKNPQKDRLAAYNELKKVSPDVIAGIKDENALTQASSKLILKNAIARQNLLKLKIQEAGITSVLSKNAEELAIKQEQLRVANLDAAKTQKDLQNSQKQNLVTGLAAVQLQQNAFSQYKSSAQQVKMLELEIKKLTGTQDQYIGQLDPIVNSIAKANLNTTQLVKSTKELKVAESDLAKQTRESNKRLAEFYANQLQDQALKNRTEELKKQAEAQKQLIKQMQESANIQMQIDATGFDPLKQILKTTEPLAIQQDIAFNQGQKIEYLKAQFLSLQSVFEKTKSGIESSLVEPFGLLFDNLTTKGKSAFEGFGKMAIGIIKKIAAQLIASGIANLISSILFPQVGAARGIMSTLSNFTKGGGLLGFGGVAAPSFGGVGPGALGMSGSVNMILRGSDLVGSINRTNTTINRVG